MPENNFQLTLISPQAISPRLVAIRAELVQHSIRVLDERHLNPGFDGHTDDAMGDAFAIRLEAELNAASRKALCHKLSTQFEIDAVIQPCSLADTPIKLACFDMDSTLIQHEVIDELAYEFGIGEKISVITELAMCGEISFKDSFNQRLAYLRGFDAALIPGIAERLKLTPGAEVLVKTLRASGAKITILSGGFENFAVFLQRRLGTLDAIYSNILEIKNGQLTGKITNELVTENRKLTLINELAEKQGIDTPQTLAVGDGANDIPMILHAGLGIAYRAKPLVQKKSPHCINHNGLAAILYVLGFEREQFVT